MVECMLLFQDVWPILQEMLLGVITLPGVREEQERGGAWNSRVSQLITTGKTLQITQTLLFNSTSLSLVFIEL